MRDSSDSILSDPETTLNFLDEMGAYALRLAESLSDISLLQNIGDGQIFRGDKAEVAQSFAEKLCAAAPIREKYLGAHFGVAVGFGELQDSALGLASPELWRLNLANSGVDKISYTEAGRRAIGLQNDAN